MNRDTNVATAFGSYTAVARRFVEARQRRQALRDFPGSIPGDLDAAYAIQEAAIALWPDEIAGWKVGRIAGEAAERLGAERLAGPIFAPNVWPAQGEQPLAFPVIEGGFAAVEAEYVFRVGEDVPAERTTWTPADAAALQGDLLIGVEIAGSPLATINELGSTVVVSDFGNNAGLILGAPIPNWRARLDELTCETFIDGRSVGAGGAPSLPGGPLEAVRFLAENCARRGRPLKKGQLISTGAATGIHDIVAGQTARVDFGTDGVIVCVAVRAAA